GTDACGNTSACSTQVVTVRMWFDIKPTSCPNPLNVGGGTSEGGGSSDEENETFTPSQTLGGNGDGAGNSLISTEGGGTASSAVVPMAIEGCDGFDVTNIDQSTVRVEGITPFGFSIEDKSAPLTVREDSCDCDTLGEDGFPDLNFKVDRDELVDTMTSIHGHPLHNGEVLVVNVTAQDTAGNSFEGRDCMVVTGAATIAGGPQSGGTSSVIPKVYKLNRNHPNPFQGSTEIRYQLPTNVLTSLKIYDVTGRLVRSLLNEKQKAGYYKVDWDGKDNGKRKVASGIYFYTLNAGDFSSTRKMTLLR
ncbi:T9SS type A sorting domain-containing protein, partial [candidate division TA06 bacterium]|nr:T9SS type A sorting domain-containing protein [candidate division TA06 bacterium]